MSETVAMAGPTPRIGPERYEVIVVTYHSRPQLEGMLLAANDEQRIAVVDNASFVDGIPELLTRFQYGRCLDGNNSGYARAANLAVRTSTAEFVVFANADSRPTPQIWEALIADLEADPRLGSVAAATVGPSGHIEIGVGGWEPTPLRSLVYAAGLHRLLPNSGVYARPEVGEQVQLEWLTGACLAIRRQLFLDLGGFVEKYRVYNEDMAFGAALRVAGMRQRLRTDLLVPHATGGSGGGGTKMSQQKGASMASYLVDHNGRLAASFMRVVLAAGISARLVLAVVRGRQSVARQHLAYVRGMVTKQSPYQFSTARQA